MKKFYTFLQVALLVTSIVTGISVINHMKTNKEQDQVYESIQSLFEEEIPEIKREEDVEVVIVENEETPDTWTEEFESRKEIYESLKEENSDLVGWISIEGTNINYPVCFTPEDPEFYLHHDIRKQRSSYGVPFINDGCDLSENSNLIISGHHMKNGAMFAPLINYIEEEFYNEHRYIHFDTMDKPGTYEIVAVATCNADGSDVPWQDIVFAENSNVFKNAWSELESQMFFETNATVEFSDKLLVLVTCEYTHADGRLLVFAKEVHRKNYGEVFD